MDFERMFEKRNRSPLLKDCGSDYITIQFLLPRILVTYWTVLELLTAEQDLLEVLLTVCPILLIVCAVASGTLQGLHS